MINQVQNYINDHYPSKYTLVAGGICLAAAIEMAILVPFDIMRISKTGLSVIEPYQYQLSDQLSANLGGAIFYGLCGLNIIPRTAAIGAGIFSIYSILNFGNKDNYITSHVIGKTFSFILKEIVTPIFKHILEPIVQKILIVVSNLLAFIGNIFIKIPLTNHPVWLGVVILGAAIGVYKLVIPRFQAHATKG